MTSAETSPGRRERKKAATRQALSAAALALFLEHGFDAVTVRQIADAADVSTTTLMKHFPTKEALVFDRDDEIERSLVSAVEGRAPKTSVFDALHLYVRTRVERAGADGRSSGFIELVLTTPALSDYWRGMWMRHEQALARVIAAELGKRDGDPWCNAMAHFVLEAFVLSMRATDTTRTLDAAFDILEHGWRRSRQNARRRRASIPGKRRATEAKKVRRKSP